MQAILLMGPTASGKTSLAVDLVERFPVEIISVDSAQIYRGLDIGSGKLEKAILEKAPHRLIDVRDPSEPYSVAEFVADAGREIEAIVAKNKTPLLVGGTMLYFKALLQGLGAMPAADESVRKEIQDFAKQHGNAEVHRQLQIIDPESAARLHVNDQQRVQRAWEVFRVTGKTMSQFRHEQAAEFCSKGAQTNIANFKLLQLAVTLEDRSTLHDRIERRFDQMLDMGLEEEVKLLKLRPDLNSDLPAIRAVGYRQVWEYLEGNIAYSEMRAKAVAATRQLAKRQLTWLRSWEGLDWVYSDHADWKKSALNQVEQFLGIS